MKLKTNIKLHGFKLHSPSWHTSNGKYKLGEWGHMKFGAGKNGRLRVHVWTGWRERGRKAYDVDDDLYVPRRIGEMIRPEHSAASSAASGNYLNALRSKF